MELKVYNLKSSPVVFPSSLHNDLSVQLNENHYTSHLDHWPTLDSAQQSEFANNSKRSKDSWIDAQRNSPGLNGRTKPEESKKPQPQMIQPKPVEADFSDSPKRLFERMEAVFRPLWTSGQLVRSPPQPVKQDLKPTKDKGRTVPVQADWSF